MGLTCCRQHGEVPRAAQQDVLLLRRLCASHNPGQSHRVVRLMALACSYACTVLDSTASSWLQVLNEPEGPHSVAGPIRVRELSFQATGTERTDPNWISQLHRPEVKGELSDARVSTAHNSWHVTAAPQPSSLLLCITPAPRRMHCRGWCVPSSARSLCSCLKTPS